MRNRANINMTVASIAPWKDLQKTASALSRQDREKKESLQGF